MEIKWNTKMKKVGLIKRKVQKWNRKHVMNKTDAIPNWTNAFIDFLPLPSCYMDSMI